MKNAHVRDQVGDQVRAPEHYTWHPLIECAAVTEWFPHNIASAIEYLWRAGRKDGVDILVDLDKAIRRIEMEKNRIENMRRWDLEESEDD